MTATRIWSFVALAPITERDRVQRLLRDSRRYHNRLVEIERRRYARYVAIRYEHAPELHAIEGAYEAADDRVGELLREVKKLRQRIYQVSEDKVRALPEAIDADIERLQKEKARLSAEAKPLRKAFKEEHLDAPREAYKERTKERAAGGGPRIKSRANAEVLAEMLDESDWSPVWKSIAQSDAEAQQEARDARAVCDLPPGTYLLVEAAFDAAKKASLPRPPGFRRFTGEGRVGVQLRNTTFSDLIAGTSMLRLCPDPKPGLKGRSERCFIARMRVCSNGRSPIWADIPVKLHRRPPDDAAVKWAWLLVRKQGERIRYSLQLTLEHPSFAEPKRPRGVGDGGHVAIGWAGVRSGIRIARWDDGQVIVPDAMIEQAAHADRLKSHAADHINVAARALRLWLHMAGHRPRHWDRALHGDRKRRWLRRVCTAYAEHRFGTNLPKVWDAWKKHRKPDPRRPGRDLFCSPSEAGAWLQRESTEDRMAWWLYLWARKDAHLRQWSADEQRKFERRRKAFFKDAAIRLATQYGSLTVDKYSVAELKKLPALTVSGDLVSKVAQHNIQIAAPGLFREVLLETMGERCRKIERPGDKLGPATARKSRKYQTRRHTHDNAHDTEIAGGE